MHWNYLVCWPLLACLWAILGCRAVGDPCAADVWCESGRCAEDADICVGRGPLQVQLHWRPRTDVDLYVQDPNGEVISYENPEGSDGVLEFDDCAGGVCLRQMNHLESVLFAEVAPPGTYTIWGRNTGCRRKVNVTFKVNENGEEPEVFEDRLPECGPGEEFSYTLR